MKNSAARSGRVKRNVELARIWLAPSVIMLVLTVSTWGALGDERSDLQDFQLRATTEAYKAAQFLFL